MLRPGSSACSPYLFGDRPVTYMPVSLFRTCPCAATCNTNTDTQWRDLYCLSTRRLLQLLPASLQRFVLHQSRSHRPHERPLDVSLSHLTALTEIDFGYCSIMVPHYVKQDTPPLLPTSLQRITCSGGMVEWGPCVLKALLPLTSLRHLEGAYFHQDLIQLAGAVTSLTHLELLYYLRDQTDDSTWGLSQAVAELQAAGVAGKVRRVLLDSEDVRSYGYSAGPEFLQELAKLPNVCDISITCQCNDYGLAAVSCLTGLTRLDMSAWPAWSPGELMQLPDVVSRMPLLHEVVLRKNCFQTARLNMAGQQALLDRLSSKVNVSRVDLTLQAEMEAAGRLEPHFMFWFKPPAPDDDDG